MKRHHDPNSRSRRSIRLKGFDYTQSGAYFVTVVVQDKACLFGEIVGKGMELNGAGMMSQTIWESLPRRFPTIGLDAFSIMPNHLHGIIVINRPAGESPVGANNDDRTTAAPRVAPTIATRSLGDVVGAYKSITTVEYVRGVKTKGWQGFRGRLWQRNYYERIIRNENELNRAREYVANNPLQWELDRENPTRKSNPAAP